MSYEGRAEDVRGHSGWLIPLALAAAILVLSALFLVWYLRPGPRSSAPTDKSNIVQLSVAGRSFTVPANYIQTPAARSGGEQAQVTVAALFPSWRGYSDADARVFAGNAPDSPVVRITLRADSSRLDAAARLERIYKPYVENAAGTPSAFGLTRYSFRRDSGYERNDLFVGNQNGLVLLLCERAGATLASPNCLAVDRPLGGGVSFSWRFKRAWLARWVEMAGGVDSLLKKFEPR
jgi:hypothetical protein